MLYCQNLNLSLSTGLALPSEWKTLGFHSVRKNEPADVQLSAKPEAERSRFVLTRLSPRLISTGQLHASRRFHLRPIDDVVYIEPYLLKSERSHLRVSFTLRCLQRLSRPDVATQLCPWQDN